MKSITPSNFEFYIINFFEGTISNCRISFKSKEMKAGNLIVLCVTMTALATTAMAIGFCREDQVRLLLILLFPTSVSYMI